MTTVGEARTVIESLPESPEALVGVLRSHVQELLGVGEFTIAEIPVPGLEGVTIPLTVDLSKMGVTA